MVAHDCLQNEYKLRFALPAAARHLQLLVPHTSISACQSLTLLLSYLPPVLLGLLCGFCFVLFWFFFIRLFWGFFWGGLIVYFTLDISSQKPWDYLWFLLYIPPLMHQKIILILSQTSLCTLFSFHCPCVLQALLSPVSRLLPLSLHFLIF